jgi:hypothetical protein
VSSAFFETFSSVLLASVCTEQYPNAHPAKITSATRGQKSFFQREKQPFADYVTSNKTWAMNQLKPPRSRALVGKSVSGAPLLNLYLEVRIENY